ncbi:MAG: TonB-dependent receptor [Flavobacteriales bacterium]
MNRQNLFIAILFVCASISTQAQTKVTGVVRDATSGETLPTATIVYGSGQGTSTDLDGKYELILESGKYTLTANYVGMEPVSKEIYVGSVPFEVNFSLQSVAMREVEIVADIAIERKTPVAYSDVSPLKIKEELGTRDLPLVLNTTPGVYATQAGGGDGDARINIRGFNQRYVAVMVDGIPMNDMENGWVYWSNWFGLDVVTQKIQVQRGLGASKLAIPSIGGTINVLSQGIDQKRQLTFSSEVGNNQNLRQTIGYNSGRLKGGWGVTASLSIRTNKGWVENLQSKQLFYFFKVHKEFARSSLSFSVMGSPQEHFQRLGRLPIVFYDRQYAADAGVNTDLYTGGDYGLRKNPNWGYLIRNRNGENPERELMTDRLNYYHKPIFNLKHFWSINEEWAVSNIAYASLGNGGGTALKTAEFNQDAQIDFQGIYERNITGTIFTPPYDLAVVNDTSQYKSKNYIFSRVNNHFWIGALSTVRYKPNKRLEISGGFDGRYYHTDRYQEMYDLLGGDYAVPDASGFDFNDRDRIVVREGDRFGYNIRTDIRQAGLFLLTEYKRDNWSAFINLTASVNAYHRTDYYGLKNPEGDYPTSGWQTFPGGTIKGGFNYNIGKWHSVFFNGGYLSRAQMARDVYTTPTGLETFLNLQNELIIAQEIGYLYNRSSWRVAINIYNTQWNNKPVNDEFSDGTEVYPYSIPGMNALHQGFEIETEWRANQKLSVEGVFASGNWRWISGGEAVITNEDGTDIIGRFQFGADGVKVGDAAQLQASLGLRYEPLKGFYLRPRFTYFDNNFSDFNPEDLQGSNANRQSWKMPGYYTLDLNAGYNRSIGQDKYRLGIRTQLMNITNEIFVTDARNNEFGNGFDAASAGVFMGMGFRWNVGVNFTF